MLHKNFSTSLLVALFAMLIGISSLNAQDITKSDVMKKHHEMKSEMAGIDVAKADANGDGDVYVCSMGCAVVDTAGRCPICEMKMNEMKVADAEKMLKGKGYFVVENQSMKKDCGAESQKPCKVKEDVATTKNCKPNCEKPCYAKKADSKMMHNKSGNEKSCCVKKTEVVSDAKPFNSVCPVSGKAVADNSPTVEYDGKTYGFCCSNCVAKFESDPSKYSKYLNEDGSQFNSGNM